MKIKVGKKYWNRKGEVRKIIRESHDDPSYQYRDEDSRVYKGTGQYSSIPPEGHEWDLVAEYTSLDEALDQFVMEMRARLKDKEDRGYTGWNDPIDVPAQELLRDIRDDARDAEALIEENEEEDLDKYTDIANRAMFLWWRSKQ